MMQLAAVELKVVWNACLEILLFVPVCFHSLRCLYLHRPRCKSYNGDLAILRGVYTCSSLTSLNRTRVYQAYMN